MPTQKIDFTQRNVPIDILRALTMLLMIFVNDLWRINGEPDWLGHAKAAEDFMGLADIVFPCFLFVVGMSIPFAIERRFSKGMSGESTVAHILTRTMALLLMGVFIVNSEAGVSEASGLNIATYRILMVAAFVLIWNLYPRTDNPKRKLTYTILKIAGLAILLYLAIIFRDNNDGIFRVRWWGILGAIGWSYLICAMTYVFTRDRLKYLVPAWIILILICILKSKTHQGMPLLDLPKGNFLDDITSLLHIGNGCLPAYTMGGIILSLLSAKFINANNKKKGLMAVIATLGLLLLGFISHQFWIISKIQATPTWLFYCTAIAVGAYSFLYWLTEKGWISWFRFISPAGTATLTCYLVPYLVYSIAYLIGFKLPDLLTTGIVGILNCIVFSFFVIGITYLLGRVHIKLKI